MVVLAACKKTQPAERWAYHQLSEQSQTGPRPFVTLDALAGPSSVDLIVECTPTGLELSFRGSLPENGATLQFDGDEPMTLPLSLSRRGVPKLDLRAPVAGATLEEHFAGAERLVVLFEVPTGEVLFDVSGADGAIARLGCAQ